MSIFANLFGYVLNFLYNLVSNYGIAIILFSILIKVLMIPLTIKQQKTLRKNEIMQKEMKQIQFKYKNDPEKMNQEIMSLYKREGMNPLSGCFSSIIQIILLFSVFLLVRSPLTYMVKMDTDVIQKMESVVLQQNQNNTYSEIAIIQYMRNLENGSSVSKDENSGDVSGNQNENLENVSENQNENSENISEENNTVNEKQNEEQKQDDFNIAEYKDKADINMDFFGIDLSQVPTKDIKNWKTLIIPVLYVISSFISIKFTTTMSKKKKEEQKQDVVVSDNEKNEPKEEEYDPMESANKTMMWIMPIMSVSIAVIAPLGLALYWLMNNILMIVERLILNKIFEKEEGVEKNA